MTKLSILLVTYNHARYIRAALDSVVAQKFAGPIELVVADDASTDATRELIRSYEGRDRRFLFKYLDAGSNVGITRNYQRGFAACSGEYVAVLEGDDYWLSRKKLAHQSKFLDRNPAYNLCSVNYYIESETGERTIRVPSGPAHHRSITAQDLIVDNLVGNFSTCMYRRSALNALPAGLFEITAYDWITNICVASDSPIAFLEEPMSVYRLHYSGAWSSKKSIDKAKDQIRLIPQYDAVTGGRFHSEFAALKDKLDRHVSVSEASTEHPPIHLDHANKHLVMFVDLLATTRRKTPDASPETITYLHDQIDRYRAVLDMP